jgi:CTP-dependent riboflavin kinase
MSREYWGVVQDGLGESSDWMPECLPELYPGTLNVKLDEIINFTKEPRVKWFKKFNFQYKENKKKNLKKTTGYVANCQINGVDAFLVNPPRVLLNQEGPLAEIGANFGLRDRLEIKNGDRVCLRFAIK